MAQIVECIPNFSEGRDPAVIEALAHTARRVPGVTLLDYSADVNHNRSVFTLIGDPLGIAEAAFQLCKTASETIDMTRQSGEHPRMGACDVIPFVPIKGITMDACVAISKSVARRIYDELGIPIFLYERSAIRPECENLANVRRGEFEGMPEKLQHPNWSPDFGTPHIHPTAGVTAVGARPPLVAFNINLNTDNLDIAKAIAKAIRGSSGGYQYCKAIGILLEDRNIAQVSMNLVNHEATPIYRVFEAVRFEAARWGVQIIGSELIGLAPAKALIDCAEYYLKLEHFDYNRQILENHLLE
ncbi:MAG: glutamate formimidoyltransferase [Oscillospiraceae bacterium]|nr:glutamate formimidoyltransferase [Oscillospiraceae bacterium]